MHKKFTSILLNWHVANSRNLPWKEDRDAYKIWVSEIILQQTRVKQGLPYYKSFIKRFPSILDLARAKEETVLKVWQGLGYYSRARNMHFTAKHIVNHMGGVFPNTYEEILSLKGVGPYTAAAIASFAFGLEYPVVDGNVLRVISRVWGIEESIDESSVQKRILSICQESISKIDPAAFNQAIMDFGATQCTPGVPDCSQCPMNKICNASKKDLVGYIPKRTKKVNNKTRHFNYAIIFVDNKVVLRRRDSRDIWKGLFEFPYMEQKAVPQTKDLYFALKENVVLGDMLKKIGAKSKLYKQKLSHQTIIGRFTMYETNHIEILDKELYQLVDISLVNNFAIPKIIDLYLSENSITLN